MKVYYESGDSVTIKTGKAELHELLKEYIPDEKDRIKIVDDIEASHGKIVGVVSGEGHKEILYQKNGTRHSWKLPVSVIVPVLFYETNDSASTTMPKEELAEKLKEYYDKEQLELAVESIAFTDGKVLSVIDKTTVIYRPNFKFKFWRVPITIFDDVIPLP